MKGDPTLPKSDAERTEKAIRLGAFEPKASEYLKEIIMKQLLIAITLIVAFAAPAAAETFANPYASTLGR